MENTQVDTSQILLRNDIRVAVVVAMEALLDKGLSFNQLTVKAVCKQAGISRTTFYRYFEDLSAPLVWYLQMAYSLGTDRIGISYTWFEGHLITSSILSKHVSLLRNVSTKVGTEYTIKHRVQRLKTVLTDYRHILVTPRIEAQLIAMMGGTIYVTKEWYAGNLKMSTKEFADFLVSIIPPELKHLYEPPVCPQEAEGINFLITQIL